MGCVVRGFIFTFVILIFMLPVSDPEGLYRGEWRWNDTTRTVSGNPANAPLVVDLVKSLKHMSSSNGGTRNHSTAMSESHMKAIHKYIMSICPGEQTPVTTLHEKDQRMRCLFFLAFSTLSWTLWTRCVAY